MSLSPTLICDRYLSLLSLADKHGGRATVEAVFDIAGRDTATAIALRGLLSFACLVEDTADGRSACVSAQASLISALGRELQRGTPLGLAIASWRSIDKIQLLRLCKQGPVAASTLVQLRQDDPLQPAVARATSAGPARRPLVA